MHNYHTMSRVISLRSFLSPPTKGWRTLKQHHKAAYPIYMTSSPSLYLTATFSFQVHSFSQYHHSQIVKDIIIHECISPFVIKIKNKTMFIGPIPANSKEDQHLKRQQSSQEDMEGFDPSSGQSPPRLSA